jgi:hypothetical protein
MRKTCHITFWYMTQFHISTIMALRLLTCPDYGTGLHEKKRGAMDLFSLFYGNTLPRPTSRIHLTLLWLWRGNACNYVIITAIWSNISWSHEVVIRENVAVKQLTNTFPRSSSDNHHDFMNRQGNKHLNHQTIRHPTFHSFIHSSMALRPFVGPWPLFQFRNSIQSR